MVSSTRKWECLECGYVYDEAEHGRRFEDLPEDWICPECGSPKSEFRLVE